MVVASLPPCSADIEQMQVISLQKVGESRIVLQDMRVHITDMFATLLLWAGLDVPKDRVIDGVDQRAFFEGRQAASNREGFLYWLGDELYGVKWRNFKLVMVEQKTLTDPALRLPNPHLINLDTDPKEREPLGYPGRRTCCKTPPRL